MKTVIIALSVAILGSGAGNAQSPAFDAAPSANVSYSDIDLSAPDGQKILQRRVARAIDELCLQDLGPSPVYFALVNCRRFGRKVALPQIERATARAQALASKEAPNADTRIVILSRQ